MTVGPMGAHRARGRGSERLHNLAPRAGRPLRKRLATMRVRALGIGGPPTYVARRVFPRALLEDSAAFDRTRDAWVRSYADAVRRYVPPDRGRILLRSIDPWGTPTIPGDWPDSVILTAELEVPEWRRPPLGVHAPPNGVTAAALDRQR